MFDGPIVERAVTFLLSHLHSLSSGHENPDSARIGNNAPRHVQRHSVVILSRSETGLERHSHLSAHDLDFLHAAETHVPDVVGFPHWRSRIVLLWLVFTVCQADVVLPQIPKGIVGMNVVYGPVFVERDQLLDHFQN